MLRLTLAALMLAAPAAADEVWSSEMGDIIYEFDQNNTAVFSFTNLDAYGALLVIPGLAGNLENRGVHDAYWLGSGSGDCPAFLALPGDEQTATTNWGRAIVSFDSPAFPTSFTLQLGWCFEDPRESMGAKAVTR